MNNRYEELKRLFLIGIIASAVTVIGGEIPIGWVETPKLKMKSYQ